MSVRDDRLPPFAWLALEDLERIRRGLPAGRQAAARNALTSLAEAASRRRDPQRRDGDTLRDLSTLSGVSERRLRDHLRDLESLGLVRIEAAVDEHNRPLPTTYILTGPDDSTGYPDETTGSDDSTGYPDTLAPNRPGLRAREKGKEEEPSLDSPSRARTAGQTTSELDDGEEELEQTVGHVRGVLQRGVDGLTSDEPARPVAVAAVRDALERFPVDPATARIVAVEVRSIAQSQNRAPNIVGLYAQRLEAASSAVDRTERDSQPALSR